MPTAPSAAARGIARRLTDEGFVIQPVLVQRWREARLLGEWHHVHAGPGSTAFAPEGAYERARLLVRLKPSDRTLANVVLLGLATGVANITASELGAAIGLFFGPVKATVARAHGDDPRDRAEAVVKETRQSRRRRAETVKLSARLEGAPEPYNSHEDEGELPASAVERTEEVATAMLAALDGDPSWVGVVASDSLHLSGLAGVATAAELDNPTVAAEFAASLGLHVGELVQAIDGVGHLTPADIEAIRTMLGLLAADGGDDLTEFAASTSPIVKPDQLTGWVTGVVLSQATQPNQFLDVLEAHHAAAERADGSATPSSH